MKKVLVPIFVAAGAVLAPNALWAQAPSDAERYARGPHMMGWGGGWPMIFGPLFMILFLAVLIAAGSLSSAGSAAREDNGATASHAAGPHAARHSQRALCARRDRQIEFEERRRVLGE
ncbi:hypothetical protein X772_24700 [Mesorhizobium sp. LSJC280B00]|nr:hypothetical protein X772_24700 [Mesorhizobium sp. LSJC280B00]